MTYLETVGTLRIQQHIMALSHYLAMGLDGLGGDVISPIEPMRRAGILTVRFDQGSPRALVEALARDGVNVSLRRGGLRFSLDFYNDSTDVDRALSSLRTALLAGPG
jgi:selenocysteine lyase/cysteine desulfurase